MNMSPWQSPRSLRASTAAAAALVALAALSGCATMLGEKTPEQQVRERAETFWKARTTADAKTAYALLTPAYRGLRTEQDFVRQAGQGSPAKSSKVADVSCEPEKCNVRVALTAKPTVPGLNLPEVTGYKSETWLLVDGQWWRHEEP